MIIEIFGIIAGVASIFGIPLTIYFSRKSENNKYDEVRKDIVNVLAHQIGDGAKLDLFEIKAIIESKLREKKLKPGKIRIQEIIEDLISTITATPLLDGQQKKIYKDNLKRISLNLNFRKALIHISEQKVLLSGQTELPKLEGEIKYKVENISKLHQDEKVEFLRTHKLNYQTNETFINQEYRKNRLYFSFSTILSITASIVSVLGFSFSIKFLDNKILIYVAISILLGIIISLISNWFVRTRRRYTLENNDDEIIEFYGTNNEE